jgi:ABC-type multidrug transport system fused ATPase/permease subunit
LPTLNANEFSPSITELSHAIIFNKVNLSYNYSAEKPEETKFALRDISFKIKRGEKVAFCGR